MRILIRIRSLWEQSARVEIWILFFLAGYVCSHRDLQDLQGIAGKHLVDLPQAKEAGRLHDINHGMPNMLPKMFQEPRYRASKDYPMMAHDPSCSDAESLFG